MATDYSHELDHVEYEWMTQAVARSYGHVPDGVTRYSFYRRKGYNKADSMAFVAAWARNIAEQHDRRLRHETGATGWVLQAGHA